jgi:thiol:disulfide interchange protein
VNGFALLSVQSAIVKLFASLRIAILAASLSTLATPSTRAGILDAVKGLFSGKEKPAAKASAPASASKWTENYDKALARAKAEKKLILLDVTGSTWCPSCKLMEKEIFSTKTFDDYAEKKLVLLRLDFPDPVIEVSGKTEWVLKYLPPGGNVGLPLIVLISADGKAIGTTGYAPGGPDPFIAELEKFARK